MVHNAAMLLLEVKLSLYLNENQAMKTY